MTMTKTIFAWTTALAGAALATTLGCASHLGEATIHVNGAGRVRSNPEGISCSEGNGGTCTAQLGRAFTLVAEPTALSSFSRWTGDDLCGRVSGATVVIGDAPDHELDCTATFAPLDAASAQ